MTATSETLQNLMMDRAVDLSLDMTANMLGLPKETVTKILQVGLPMMARVANENPELFKSLYAQSVTLLPESVQQFYAKLAEDPEARQAVLDEFKTTVGPMTEAINREAAQQTGTTQDQAGTALATTYPAVAQALNAANATQDEAGFAQRLQALRT